MQNKNKIFNFILLLFQGVLVGFGAILPGLSGGTLLIAFGMYKPLIEFISHPFKNFKKSFLMIAIFMIGVAIGFVGLSGLTNFLMEQNMNLLVCVFIGFIIGTLPDLYKDAIEVEKASAKSYISLGIGFIVMLSILLLLKSGGEMIIEPNFMSYMLCGLCWGLSFIVPGLSSSSLLLFFGLYKPMLDGISTLNFGVLIPLGIAMVLTVLLLSKGVSLLIKKFHNIVSFAIIGIVIATTIMIIPPLNVEFVQILLYILMIVIGTIISLLLSSLMRKLKEKTELQEN